MKSHFASLVVYSFLVSMTLSLIMRDGVRERLRFCLFLAGSMVAVAVAIGWLMLLVG